MGHLQLDRLLSADGPLLDGILSADGPLLNGILAAGTKIILDLTSRPTVIQKVHWSKDFDQPKWQQVVQHQAKPMRMSLMGRPVRITSIKLSSPKALPATNMSCQLINSETIIDRTKTVTPKAIFDCKRKFIEIISYGKWKSCIYDKIVFRLIMVRLVIFLMNWRDDRSQPDHNCWMPMDCSHCVMIKQITIHRITEFTKINLVCVFFFHRAVF